MSQELVRTTPEAVGIPSSAVSAFVAAVEAKSPGLHSFMLLRHGQVAAEAWWPPYAPRRAHMLFSLSKAFTSTAVGLAVSEGLLSVDDPVSKFFPEEMPAVVSPHLAEMTVHHLLSMNTGHHKDASESTFTPANRDLARRFLRVPVKHKPGTWFVYNTAATYMLSAIVHRLTGMPIVEYLQPRLFDPLGIAPPAWESDAQGVNMGGFGLNLKTEDIARFGQMLLQKGRWGDRQLVPAAWVEAASSYHSDNSIRGGNPEWTQGYGYQFWLCRHGAYRGDGAFGQYCLVMPAQDAVLAITSGIGDMQPPLDAVWDHLLPAMADAPLKVDATASRALSRQLAGLKIAPQEGSATSPVAAWIAGRPYAIDPNRAVVRRLRVDLDASGGTLTVRDRSGSHTVTFAVGAWAEGATTLNVQTRRSAPPAVENPVAASAAWTAPDTLAIKLCYVTTPFIAMLTLHFDGDTVAASYITNVGFGPGGAIEMVGKVSR
ncbi:MAG: serine hydrolase domain-containing protein [Anaerolineae bacterium]